MDMSKTETDTAQPVSKMNIDALNVLKYIKNIKPAAYEINGVQIGTTLFKVPKSLVSNLLPEDVSADYLGRARNDEVEYPELPAVGVRGYNAMSAIVRSLHSPYMNKESSWYGMSVPMATLSENDSEYTIAIRGKQKYEAFPAIDVAKTLGIEDSFAQRVKQDGVFSARIKAR